MKTYLQFISIKKKTIFKHNNNNNGKTKVNNFLICIIN